MKAGFFECDITPSIGMERPAIYAKLHIREIHDPLKVRAVVLSDGTTTMAFAGVDILYLGNGVYERVRKALPGIHILLSASHTHYGGPMGMSEAPQGAPDSIRRLFTEESVTSDPAYTDHLVGQITSAVKMARMRMEEVLLSFGKGNAQGISFNRGFRMKDGHRATHPGRGNPDIEAPFAPIDTEVGVLGFWRKSDASFLGCMVNFSCHGTCDGTGATADWPGQMVRTIRAVMGESAGIVYLYGCAGDITQIDNLSLNPNQSGPEYSRIVGVSVGAEALKLMMTAPKGEISVFRTASDSIILKRRKPSEQSVRDARKIVDQWQRGTMAFDFAKERLMADALYKESPQISYALHLFQIGPLVIAAFAGEAFSGIGLAIKHASKFPFTWASSLANETCGYIPTSDVMDPETGGGYESRLTSYSCLEPAAADKIIAKVNAMIAQWTPDSVPVGPQAPPQTKIWDYGNTLPELE